MSLGRSALLVKLDLSNTYRIIPVHPDDQPLLGATWRGNTYLDRSLPFGLRSTPKIFNAMADFLAWCLRYNHMPWVIHYLDNFLIIGPAGSTLASSMWPQAEFCWTMWVPLLRATRLKALDCSDFSGNSH